jgi:3-dehydroquinate dehydratase-1
MKTLEIKGLRIGTGMPKTIVSLMGSTEEECLAEIEAARKAGVDMLEWRADLAGCAHDSLALADMGRTLAQAVPDIPLLFAFRTVREGGALPLDASEYDALIRLLIETDAPDLIDIEAWLGNDGVPELVGLAHAHSIATVVSYHDFQLTPDTDWMVDLLRNMVRMGADIPKVAVMATGPGDTLHLLEATERARRLLDAPLLTMAMGRDGAISRLTGEQFGSSITFCALEKASAPGQVDLTRAKRIMADLHAILREQCRAHESRAKSGSSDPL